MEPKEVDNVEQVLRDHGALTGDQGHDDLMVASTRLLAAGLGFTSMQLRRVEAEPLTPDSEKAVGFMMFLHNDHGQTIAFGSLTPAGAAVNALEAFMEGSSCPLCSGMVAFISPVLGHSPIATVLEGNFCQYTVQGKQWTPQCLKERSSSGISLDALFPGGQPGHPNLN